MYTTRANYKKMQKSFNDLRDYIEEKFDDMNNKYGKPKATLSNDTVEKFKEILKEKSVKLMTNQKVRFTNFVIVKISFKSKLAIKNTEQSHCSYL